MQNLSDEELDDRMKQAAEFKDYVYDEASWQNVRSRLDSSAKAPFWKKKTTIVLLIVLIGAFMTTWQYATLQTDNNLYELNILNSELSATVSKSAEDNREHPAQLSESDEDETKLNSENQPAKTTSQKASRVLNESQQLPLENRNRFFTIPEFSNEQTNELNSENRQTKDRSIVFNQNNKDQQPVEYVENAEVMNTTMPDSISSLTESSSEDAPVDTLLTSLKEDEESKKKENRFWSVKLAVSPDLSAQSFSTTARMGFNYGIALEYRINNAIGISAGILHARKYYTAKNIEYGRYTAEYAEGDCSMWDIPIQVNYYFITSRALQPFASIGLSSYLMNTENYTYYPQADNMNIGYNSVIENENKEWFKVLNLSIGLQHSINKSLFVQVEPFVKVPLGEMGAGNIAISSIGLSLNLNYQFKK